MTTTQKTWTGSAGRYAFGQYRLIREHRWLPSPRGHAKTSVWVAYDYTAGADDRIELATFLSLAAAKRHIEAL